MLSEVCSPGGCCTGVLLQNMGSRLVSVRNCLHANLPFCLPSVTFKSDLNGLGVDAPENNCAGQIFLIQKNPFSYDPRRVIKKIKIGKWPSSQPDLWRTRNSDLLWSRHIIYRGSSRDLCGGLWGHGRVAGSLKLKGCLLSLPAWRRQRGAFKPVLCPIYSICSQLVLAG